jgi:Na+-transporting methylmalonyl-CoA/oxaloacetate decarboxylase gamma subunit
MEEKQKGQQVVQGLLALFILIIAINLIGEWYNSRTVSPAEITKTINDADEECRYLVRERIRLTIITNGNPVIRSQLKEIKEESEDCKTSLKQLESLK